jgi:DNA-binding CsgD family transcriptional regulator
MSKKNAVIAESDSRAMVRLLGETAAVDGGHAEKKRYLMDGLCGLINANAWAWTLSCSTEPGAPQSYVGILHGGFSEDRITKFMLALSHPGMGPPVARFNARLADGGGMVTMQRTEIDPEGLACVPELNQLWIDANIEHLIMGGYPVDACSASCLGIYRPFGAPAFTEREMQIAHIILSEVPWLHMSGWPEDRGVLVPKLAPRQKTILYMLLDGRARKDIAYSIGISENTVSSYVKEIYRLFSVNSQPELMRKYLHGHSERMGTP